MIVIPSTNEDNELELAGWFCLGCGATTTMKGQIIYGTCSCCDSGIIADMIIIEEGVGTEIETFVCSGCGITYAELPPNPTKRYVRDEVRKDQFVSMAFREDTAIMRGTTKVLFEIRKHGQWQLIDLDNDIIATFDGRYRVQVAITAWINNTLAKCEVLTTPIVHYHSNGKFSGGSILASVPITVEVEIVPEDTENKSGSA